MWERCCIRIRPEDGFVLLMAHYERLWHMGTRVEQGVKKLAKNWDGGSNGIVWGFVRIYPALSTLARHSAPST